MGTPVSDGSSDTNQSNTHGGNQSNASQHASNAMNAGSGLGSGSGAGASSESPLQFTISRAQQVVFQPKECWTEIQSETLSIAEIYKKYLIYLAAIPAICGFIGYTIIGTTLPFIGTVRMPFFSGLAYHVVQYGAMLGLIYINAVIVQKLASVWNVPTPLETTFKLLAYSFTPGMLAGVFSILPGFMAFVGALLSIYGIYVLYQGMARLIAIPQEGKTKFFVASFLSMIVASMVVMFIVNRALYPSFPNLTDGSKVDMKQVERTLENLQKVLPLQK